MNVLQFEKFAAHIKTKENEDDPKYQKDFSNTNLVGNKTTKKNRDHGAAGHKGR